MARTLKSGDRVAWRSSVGGSVGRVERELTTPAQLLQLIQTSAHKSAPMVTPLEAS